MDLTEDDVTLFAVNGPPAADAPLQRATHPGRQFGMTPHHLLEHCDGAHARCRLEQGDHFGVKDLGQGIGAAPFAR